MLNTVLDGLERLRDPIDKQEAIKLLQDAQIKVEQCAYDEQDAFDGLPESFRWSERSDTMSDNISDLFEASADLEVLTEDVNSTDVFNYESIKPEVANIVNSIKQAIHR